MAEFSGGFRNRLKGRLKEKKEKEEKEKEEGGLYNR